MGNHDESIEFLRQRTERLRTVLVEVRIPSAGIPLEAAQLDKSQLANLLETVALANATAADLLELHDQTGISLDNWEAARDLVEHLLGYAIEENGV